MKISKKGIEFIKDLEGLSLKAYTCSAGWYTIGYGHTKGVKLTDKITLEQAEKLLLEDLKPIEQELSIVDALVHLNQNQYDALCSFIFNIGLGNFKSSTMRKLLLKKEFDLVPQQFLRWNKITDPQTYKKVPLKGLTIRRTKEKELFEKV